MVTPDGLMVQEADCSNYEDEKRGLNLAWDVLKVNFLHLLSFERTKTNVSHIFFSFSFHRRTICQIDFTQSTHLIEESNYMKFT